MSKLIDLEPTQSTTHVAQEAYTQTLAKHHSFFIRHAAYFSMNLLPCQKNLYHQVPTYCFILILNLITLMINVILIQKKIVLFRLLVKNPLKKH